MLAWLLRSIGRFRVIIPTTMTLSQITGRSWGKGFMIQKSSVPTIGASGSSGCFSISAAASTVSVGGADFAKTEWRSIASLNWLWCALSRSKTSVTYLTWIGSASCYTKCTWSHGSDWQSTMVAITWSMMMTRKNIWSAEWVQSMTQSCKASIRKMIALISAYFKI